MTADDPTTQLTTHSSKSNVPPPELIESLECAWQTARETLRCSMNASGHWTGELSTSALSTATAISALAQTQLSQSIAEEQRAIVAESIAVGCQWLSEHQNADGGFGDTNRSHSNIATSLLVLAAWELASQVIGQTDAMSGYWEKNVEQKRWTWQYVEQQGKWEGLRRRYGKDKTFVVPILSNCALAGLVPWRDVPTLPFEAAWLPQELYRWARMPVVSYAIPALVAIGQARYHFAPPGNALLRALRRRAIAPTLRVLRSMQPESGGYLEATPLTSFVLMSLAAVGNGRLPVAQECLKFILDSRLPDGSWPIDTNLATWLTSLSIHSLATRGKIELCKSVQQVAAEPEQSDLSPHACRTLCKSEEHLVAPQTIRWLLGCQHRRRHPFTGANPGGWGWTDLSGAVPDADDTPAALIALSEINWSKNTWMRLEYQVLEAVGLGLGWLLRLQNRDGGWPTFCRGWGTLPFDRSGTDLTAHALRALHAWLPKLDRVRQVAGTATPHARQIGLAVKRGFAYLENNQREDGSWLPLWFGNQDRAEEDNPVYGTGKVLLAYGELRRFTSRPAVRAVEYLTKQQNEDGGWGGGASVRYAGLSGNSTSTIEETAIALEGLIRCGQSPFAQLTGDAAIMRGLRWLALAVQSGNLRESWPIGFYFAKLWYHERLYPAIFSLAALGSALAALKSELPSDPQA